MSLNLPSTALSHLFNNLRLNSQYSFRVYASTAVGDGEPTRLVVASTVNQGYLQLDTPAIFNEFFSGSDLTSIRQLLKYLVTHPQTSKLADVFNVKCLITVHLWHANYDFESYL